MEKSDKSLSAVRANILGMGPSLNAFLSNEKADGITIGVNDIFSRIETEYVVCADKQSAFPLQRREIICNCKPKKFYSYSDEWRECQGERFEKLNVTGRFDAKKFHDWSALPRGLDSTFIACMVGYHLGARLIVLYGADFIGHPNLGTPDKIDRLQKCYRELHMAMAGKGCALKLGSAEGALKDILPVVSSTIPA